MNDQYEKEVEKNIEDALPELKAYYIDNKELVQQAITYKQTALLAMKMITETSNFNDFIQESFYDTVDYFGKTLFSRIKNNDFPLISAFTKMEICLTVACTYFAFRGEKNEV